MIELYSTGNHLWELKEYSRNIILRGISIYTKKKDIQMKNNSYISKSILTMSNSRCILEKGYIYLLIQYYVMNKKDKKKDKKKVKELNKIKKIYEYFYELR